MTTDAIRPAVQALIARGNVEIDEIEHLQPHCNRVETEALIPVWTNSSLSRELDRALVNLKLPPGAGTGWWTLYFDLQEAQKAIERPIGKPHATTLAASLAIDFKTLGGLPATASGYEQIIWQLGTEVQRRLQNWPA